MVKSVSSGVLKATLATALSLPDRKVDYPHRVVQEAGEISRGKRGRGGADVTPRDAAMTIIAIASSFVGDEVITAARDFSALTLSHVAHITSTGPDKRGWFRPTRKGWTEIGGGPWQFQSFRLPHLQKLPARHSVIDVLTAIIEAARDNAFHAALAEACPNDPLRHHDIAVVFHGPELGVSIEIQMNGGSRHYEEHGGYHAAQRKLSLENTGACEITFKLGWQPLYALAKLFRDTEQ